MTDQNRRKFREQVFDRDDNTCTVPWCDAPADEAHHIIERALWDNGGYIVPNGASVCNPNHQYAEKNIIPPQAFWMWLNIQSPATPTWSKNVKQSMLDTWGWFDDVESLTGTWNVDKWGEPFVRPYNEHLRDTIKYQSTRHLLPLYWHDDTLASERIENDDTEVQSLDHLVGIPLVITRKMDGGNCMLVSDTETPVRARNGSSPEDTMRPLYRDGGLYWQQKVNQKLPDHLQVFGEWLYAKHSIHYGCDCETPCDDIGPSLSELTGVTDDRAYFQVFGVFNTALNVWLSWPSTQRIADELGFPTVPVLYSEEGLATATFETVPEARQALLEYAHQVVAEGGEGIVVRSKHPYHYGQFPTRLGKYVRENHVDDDATHWSNREVVENLV